MHHVNSSYPPPLSAPPTVETLERLLAGLSRPMERAVPTAPVVDLTDDVLFGDDGDDDRAGGWGAAPQPQGTWVAADVQRAPVTTPTLTWSAHGRRRAGMAMLGPSAGLVATTVAAALATALAAGVRLP